MSDKKKSCKKILSPRSTVRTLALKFYAEQVPEWQDDQHKLEAPIMCGNVSLDAVQANHSNAKLAKDVIESKIRLIDKSEMQVIAIVHDQDIVVNEKDFWDPPTEKPHFHIIIRIMSKTPTKVSTILNKLGVVYRKGVDDELWLNHGVETVVDFAGYAMYLTHETDKARADGKHEYDFDELISNLTPDELRDVRKGYIDPSRMKVRVEDMAKLDETAYGMGYKLEDFHKWYRSLPFEVRSHSKMKTVRESYNAGLEDRIDDGVPLTRFCVFIPGEKNVGKTYASEQFFRNRKIPMVSVNGGGTGKFDHLRAYHDAIIIDDDTCPNLLNMADNRACRAYKRGGPNSPWIGRYLIVTSNKPFDEWLDDCGIKDEENRKAARSRFYLCHLERIDGANQLVLDEASKRGTDDEQRKRADMFQDFQKEFNDVIRTYTPSACSVDYDELEGKYVKARRKEQDIINDAIWEMNFCLGTHGYVKDNEANRIGRDHHFMAGKYEKDFSIDPFVRRLNEECGADRLMEREDVLRELYGLETEYQEIIDAMSDIMQTAADAGKGEQK